MDIYSLSRHFWDFAFENTDKIKPIHSAIYFFAIEHCNRLGWKEKFGFPTSMVLEAIGVKSYNTYKAAFQDLVDWGFFKVIEYSKNQYSSNIIAISNFNKAQYKALDKALTKHSTKHSTKHTTKQSESTVQSTGSIDIQDYNNTNLQDYNNTNLPENKIKENDFSEIKISDFLENSEEEKKEIITDEKITIILNPEEKKEEKSSAKKEEIKRKESDKLYKTFCKCYNTFCLSKLGHNAKFDGAEGKAASNIVKWCRDNHYDENKIKDVFEFIFKNWDKLPEFYQMGVTLHSVDRNLINIMNWFKNGRDTREYQKRKAEDEYKEFFNNI